MKKNIIIIFCFAILVSIPAFTYSAEGFYLSGNFGLAAPTDSDVTDSTMPGDTFVFDLDGGWAFGVAAGYGFSKNLRFEVEAVYQKNDLKNIIYMNTGFPADGDVTNSGLLLNGYCDIINGSNFISFLSGGVGYNEYKIKDMSVQGVPLPPESYDDTIFVFHIGGGVGYMLNSDVTLDFKYRYLMGSDPEFGTTKAEFKTHNFYMGLRLAF